METTQPPTTEQPEPEQPDTLSQVGSHHQTAPRDNEIGLIIGRKGSGKTTLARHIATLCKRVLILDTLGTDYGGGCVVDSVKGLQAYWHQVRDFGDFCIIVRPKGKDVIDAYFRLVRENVNVWAIVEECDRYCSPWDIQPDLNWSINYGRQFGQSIIGCARRPAAVNRTWTANADWVVVHQVQEPADVDYLYKIRGFDPEELHTLPDFEWSMSGSSRLRF